jgi:DNA-directed RNA polymerase subunit RPC12/RpoP
MISYKCEHCGEEVTAVTFFKVEHNGLTEKYTVHRCKCPLCDKISNVDKGPTLTRPSLNPSHDRATKRILGTNQMIVGYTRWEDRPSDLFEKLEEEKRLREERLSEQARTEEGNGKEEDDSSSEETLD